MATVTLEDVARRAGVSRSLVSLALKGSTRVSATTRARIVSAAEELGYRPNLNARRLASARSNTLGVVLADLHNPVYAEILEGISASNGEDSQQLLLASGFRDPVRERAGLEFLIAQQVEGVLIAGPLCSDEDLQLIARQVPLVVIGRSVPTLDSVLVDDALGLRQAVEHLVELGHERIVHIDGGEGAGSVSRRRSYEATMRAHGLQSEIRVMAGDYSEQGGRSAAALLLGEDRPPTAIVAANDLSAIGVLAAARSAGVSVPDDLSVVGFDNTALAHNGYVDLTTVDYPRDLMGTTARELLTERIAEQPGRAARVVVVPTSLMPRSTSAAPPVRSAQPAPPGRPATRRSR